MKTSSLNLRQYAVITGIALSGVGAIGTSTPVSALTFKFNPASGTTQEAIDGFTAAGALWSAKLTNDVNVSIDIDFARLGTDILAQAGSVRRDFNYSNVYTALSNGQTSIDDRAAVASLPIGSFNMLLNRTSTNLNGSGSATPYLDANGSANNTNINMSQANAKALGLINGATAPIMSNVLMVKSNNGVMIGPNTTTVAGGSATVINQIVPQNSAITTALTTGADASITFSNQYTYSFDFDRNGTIAANSFDFVGLATHEIGHVLGFTSGVDVLDVNSPPRRLFTEDELADVNTLDLFRYSTDSNRVGAIDWTADDRQKYFSLDRGVTNIALFANGVINGDGDQASHWKDNNSSLGIMDPTAAAGEKLVIVENDLRAFDAIGWNRASVTATAVPEPADFLGTFMFAAFTAELIFKRRQKLFKSTAKAATEAA